MFVDINCFYITLMLLDIVIGFGNFILVKHL